jgi:biotin transport system substrate-specific component
MNRSTTLRPVLLDVAWPATGLRRSAVLVAAGAVLISLLAQLKVPLWPVPVTGQTFGVLLIGAALGSRLGAVTVLTYIAWGALGLPVFAGAASGPAALFGPTGGYLVGFVISAYVVGRLGERGWDRHTLTTGAAMLIGTALLFVPGLVWLSRFVGWDRVLDLGLYPFVIGAFIKITLAALALPVAWKLTGSDRHLEGSQRG